MSKTEWYVLKPVSISMAIISFGSYSTSVKAAVAYNKAVDLAKRHGIAKNFPENYVEELSAKEYAELYTKIKISKKFLAYLDSMSSISD